MRKVILLLLCLFCTHISFSQKSTFYASIEATGLSGTKNTLPFWFTSNNSGRFSSSENWQRIAEGLIHGTVPVRKSMRFLYGSDIAFASGKNDTETKVIQAYAALMGKTLTIKGGAFCDNEILGGLSASNGNIVRSLNYRPYPMIRLSTSGFIPIPIGQRRFSFKAEYDEGLLLDSGSVYRRHINHNLLALRYSPNNSLRFTFEVNRYIFWGGYSETYGQLPEDIGSYFRYIFGLKGSSKFLTTDQENVAGDQLGSYTLSAVSDMDKYQMHFRICHPFEDGSGMEFYNYKDNLYTFYIKKLKQGSLLDEVLVEYLYSKNQSGGSTQASGRWKYPHGMDDYFNHGVYQNGFTYYGYSMGTPLFSTATKNPDGTTNGFENNRIEAFHAGAKGFISKQIAWKSMVTYTLNYGTYSKPYNPVRNQFYSLAELVWKSKSHPFSVSSLFAADFGDMVEKQFGFGFTLHVNI